MDTKKVIKKGAEPAAAIPILVVAVESVAKTIDIELSPANAAIVAGFIYGVYRSVKNFFKHR